MSTLLSAWQEMNRGILTRDLAIVGTRAREIQALGRVMSWDAVIQENFGLTDPQERKEFRQILARLSAAAIRVEQAAREEKSADLTRAKADMWTTGCLECHARFRRPGAQRAP